jgi:predicted membrane protein
MSSLLNGIVSGIAFVGALLFVLLVFVGCALMLLLVSVWVYPSLLWRSLTRRTVCLGDRRHVPLVRRKYPDWH